MIDSYLEYSLLERGGPVMWLLLAVSLFGFIVFVERMLFLHRGQIRTEPFLQGIKNLVQKGRLVEALTVCEETPGPVSGVVKAGLLHAREAEPGLRRSIESAALVEIPILERRIGSISAVARIAPLLGLIGTLLSLMAGFVALQNGDNPAYPTFGSLLGTVGEAMLTTIVGLMIAVMAHVAHHFLHGRVRALVHDMEYSGHHLMQFLLNDLTDSEVRPESEEAPTDGKSG